MLSELCVRRPVFATMLVMVFVVLGLFSFRDLGVDLFPRADPATVNVSLALPGASPDEISSSVIEPMEEAISGVSGIDEISARISEGKGNVTVRFVLERDLNDAVNDVQNVVVQTKNGTPIRVSDIGYAEDSFERPTSSVWFGDKPAVQLDVRRAMGENTVAVIEGVRARLQSIQRALPTSVKVTIVADDSKFIYASIASLEEHLIFGSLFAAIVVIFLPIAFMNGYAKRFINPFGWTMAFSIVVSMLVSFTLTPMLSSRVLKLSDAVADHKTKEKGFFHWLDQWYSRQVNRALDHPGVIIAVSVIAFLF